MTAAVVQFAESPNLTVTLGAPPSAGNVLILQWEGVNFGSCDDPAGFTKLGPTVQAHPSFGGLTALYYRLVQPGDPAAWPIVTHGGCLVRLLEYSGVSTLSIGTPVSATMQAGSTTLALPITATSGDVLIAAFCTRLRTPATFTANADTTEHDGFIDPPRNMGVHTYNPGVVGTRTVVMGGTQSGTTEDGYNWGAVGVNFSAPVVAGGATFPGEPGGSVW